ncbi:hypothetical protein [Candidatus Regiella insecticola]|uniref:hypothetical protein n=1 Tax=Candidatus Regiella insecticola TaxID=138073 RepID=UPI000587A312|nr:hypothetical protein [Candidatus Regiella insecticola]
MPTGKGFHAVIEAIKAMNRLMKVSGGNTPCHPSKAFFIQSQWFFLLVVECNRRSLPWTRTRGNNCRLERKVIIRQKVKKAAVPMRV